MKRTLQICLILLLFLTSCQTDIRLEINEKIINKFLEENSKNQENILILDTISSFEWNEIIVAGPYSNFEEIGSETKYQLQKFPNTIKSHDHYIFVGFINNKKGLYYIEIPIFLLPDYLYKGSGKNYKIYPRKNSNLHL